MSAPARGIGLGLLSSAGVALAVRLAGTPVLPTLLPPPARPRVAATNETDGAVPETLAATMVLHDPFRLDRRPALVAYDPARGGRGAPTAAPKPAILLTGIVWDAQGDPSAILDGLPGGGGPRVVRAGDQVGSLRVRRITPDRVVITGVDTTWTLTVREPWH